MATELAKAYVQIVPSAKGIKGKITEELGGEAASAGSSAGESFGQNLVGKIKTVIVAAGLGKLLSSAISEGANLEQSIGGVETLFKDSADQMKAYAKDAYKTAGLSANDYMETATSFAASLVSGLKGDTQAAAELANTAIVDMSDNANKMGTDMQSIQNAYQGFAKQNYTMLDNLKLGYGGTQSEMIRLINDSGVLGKKIDSLDNVTFDQMIQAIHVVQQNLGVTGTTAAEAAETISGSLNSLKAAWSNVLGNLALGNDLTEPLNALADTFGTFVGKNLIPALSNILSALPSAIGSMITKIAPGLVAQGMELVKSLVSGAAATIPDVTKTGSEILVSLSRTIKEGLPDLVNDGMEILSSFVNGIIDGIPTVLSAGSEVVNNFLETIGKMLPSVIQTGSRILQNLIQGIVNNYSTYISMISSLITTFLQQIIQNLPMILQEGVQILNALISGIMQNIPALISAMGTILNAALAFIFDALPQILQAGAQLLLNLVQGIIDNVPAIIAAITDVISQLLNTLVSHLPELLRQGMEIIKNLAEGILNNIPALITAIAKAAANLLETLAGKFPELVTTGVSMLVELGSGLIKGIPDLIGKIPEILGAIVDAFLSFDWLSIGKDIISGIGEGIKNAAGALWDGIKSVGSSVVGGFKSFFGIGSPSKLMRDEIGKWIPSGIAVGVEGNLKPLQDAMKEATDVTESAAAVAINAGTADAAGMLGKVSGGDRKTEEKLDAVIKLLGKYLPDCAKEAVIDGDSLTQEIDRRLGLAVM